MWSIEELDCWERQPPWALRAPVYACWTQSNYLELSSLCSLSRRWQGRSRRPQEADAPIHSPGDETGLLLVSESAGPLQPGWETVWRFLKKLKIAVLCWVHIWKKNKNTNSKTHMHPNFHNSFIYNCLGMEAIEKIINRWMDKDVVHIYNGILLRHEKEQNFAICNNMDGFGGHYAKWSKSHRERQILGNFPGSPVIRALCFHCRGQGFNPWLHAVC